MSKKVLSLALLISCLGFGQAQAGFIQEAKEAASNVKTAASNFFEGFSSAAKEEPATEVVELNTDGEADVDLAVGTPETVEFEATTEEVVVEVAEDTDVATDALKTETVEVEAATEEVVAQEEEATQGFFSSTTESITGTISEHKKSSMVVAVAALIAAGYYLDTKFNLVDRTADYLGLNDEDEDEDELEIV